MATTVRIEWGLAHRLDKKQAELGFKTRSNLIELLLGKGLDFLDASGFDALIKIPSTGEKSRTILDEEIVREW